MPSNESVFLSENQILLKVGKILSLALSISTLITLAFALMAVPISGVNGPKNGAFSFPYLNTITQFPKDFIWQVVALFQLIIFLVFVLLVRHVTKKEREFFANAASTFSLMAVTILSIAYYTQLMVVPSSLSKNETDGLGLLIQYNPHGLFIALEELGYLMMSLGLIFLIPIAGKGVKRYRPVMAVILVSGLVNLISFGTILWAYGIDKQDRFEIVVISTNWIALIILGILFFRIFKNEGKPSSLGNQDDPGQRESH